MKKITLLFAVGMLSVLSVFAQTVVVETDTVSFLTTNYSNNTGKIDWHNTHGQDAMVKDGTPTNHSTFYIQPNNVATPAAGIDSVALNFNVVTIDPENESVDIEFYYKSPYAGPAKWLQDGYPTDCSILGTMTISAVGDYRLSTESLTAHIKAMVDGTRNCPVYVRMVTENSSLTIKGRVSGKLSASWSIYSTTVPTALTSISGKSVSLFPQPVSNGMLNISGAEVVSAEVYSITGSCLLIPTVVANQVNVSELNSGLYFIKMDTNQGSMMKQFIIE